MQHTIQQAALQRYSRVKNISINQKISHREIGMLIDLRHHVYSTMCADFLLAKFSV